MYNIWITDLDKGLIKWLKSTAELLPISLVRNVYFGRVEGTTFDVLVPYSFKPHGQCTAKLAELVQRQKVSRLPCFALERAGLCSKLHSHTILQPRPLTKFFSEEPGNKSGLMHITSDN
jgi:hypothetical protein